MVDHVEKSMQNRQEKSTTAVIEEHLLIQMVRWREIFIGVKNVDPSILMPFDTNLEH